MEDITVKNGITIPGCELEIATSRSSGPGGQHVNKTDSRITVRWNIKTTQALNEQQRERVLAKLESRLTSEGELVVHCDSSRSQQQNKQLALEQLAEAILKALLVPKKRMATRISKSVKESRLQSKKLHSGIKKMRSTKIESD